MSSRRRDQLSPEKDVVALTVIMGKRPAEIVRQTGYSMRFVLGILHRHKNRARRQTVRALRDGRLTRPATCEECGTGGRIEAHHGDYFKPLDVRWLCKPCHARADGVRREADRLDPWKYLYPLPYALLLLVLTMTLIGCTDVTAPEPEPQAVRFGGFDAPLVSASIPGCDERDRKSVV